jgi:hypothetical protein
MGAVAQWKAFDHYLTEVARGRSVLPGPSELELCLPYWPRSECCRLC